MPCLTQTEVAMPPAPRLWDSPPCLSDLPSKPSAAGLWLTSRTLLSLASAHITSDWAQRSATLSFPSWAHSSLFTWHLCGHMSVPSSYLQSLDFTFHVCLSYLPKEIRSLRVGIASYIFSVRHITPKLGSQKAKPLQNVA